MSFLSNLSFNAPSWDLFLVLFFVVGVLLYGLSLGRDRVVMLMVSIYMGLAIVTNAPYLKDFTATLSFNQFAFQIGAFFGFFTLMFILLSRSALFKNWESGMAGGLWQTVIFSVLHVGLIASVAMSFLPEASLAHFSDTTRGLFLSDPGKFTWLVAPVAAMMIFGRNSK